MALDVSDDDVRRRNVRLGWILASVALTFFLGFVVKIMWLTPH
jgi:hypothetical protein